MTPIGIADAVPRPAAIAEQVGLVLVRTRRSGDGPNIGGRPLAAARGEALAKGFTINALAIRRPGGRPGGPGGEPLEEYYAREVIGGPGAFVEVADETRPFALAARRKLLTEVAGHPVPGRHFAAQSR